MPYGTFLYIEIISHKQPYKEQYHISYCQRLSFHNSKDTFFSFSFQNVISNKDSNKIWHCNDHKEIIFNSLYKIAVKQSVNCPLKATPWAAQASNQLKGTLGHKGIRNRVEVVKCNTSHHAQHEYAGNQFFFHSFCTISQKARTPQRSLPHKSGIQ